MRFLIFFLCILLGSCTTEEETTGTSQGSDYNPPVGVIDPAGFYVTARAKAGVTIDTHKDETGFGEACLADRGELIDCIIDIREEDLWSLGLELQYNVPSKVCQFLVVSPYYFYRYEVGNGDSAVQVDTDSNGDVGVDTDNDGTVDEAVTTCDYDYSSTGGPNCCLGEYTKTTRSWDAVGSVYTVDSTQTEVKWGGKVSTCLGGPALDSQSLTEDGIPIPTEYEVLDTGINSTYPITAPQEKGPLASNVHIANYFKASEHSGGIPAPVVQPYYSFTCYDESFEIISRIRVMIREWNRNIDFANRTTVPTAHDTTGQEDPPFSSAGLNDRNDWKDFGNSYPGSGL
jgi:hypothetical protein